ncbi:signal recognition particle protein [Alphaproteobacteria bacterium]|nr:signal recognition particle protein [Alphaproteobacteria bacterium]GHS97193.1 signal recognition particle protein [Alphaproteobacteria bacterium]
MFDSLSQKLISVFDRLRGRGALTEADLDAALREIRLVLLEADVALSAVKVLLERTKERALGRDIFKGITPGQMIIKCVYEELVDFLGTDIVPFNTKANSPFSYLFVGLQGSGKTTSVAKVARNLKKTHNLLLVSLDVYRPAAFEQLRVLAEKIEAPCFDGDKNEKPLAIAQKALAWAGKNNVDIVLFDTAGRTHIDNVLMQEIQTLQEKIQPLETLLVADSMMGQEAGTIAKTFHACVPLSGLILTRVDGDARGGAALSLRFVTGCPIKGLGTGEAVEKFSPFDPKRMVDQILDRGDVLQLVESAAELMENSLVEKTQKRLKKRKFDLNDLKEHLEQVKKMGNASSFFKLLPGARKLDKIMKESGQTLQESDKKIVRQVALIQAMTPKERNHPEILNASRRKRIAAGAGQTVMDLNRLVKSFEQTRDILKKVIKTGAEKDWEAITKKILEQR